MAKPKIKPRIPKGMRDFLPQDMLKREYVFDVVREVFHLYGFEPLQTPVLEMQDTLMGKYGEDAEKLIYLAGHPNGKEELAMRYDLTVPLARVSAMYQNDINLPFKRYQLSPVWRAERPQRGRFREFFQCDADIVGVAEMSADAEVVGLLIMALRRLGFENFVVKINNRKLLTAIGEYSGVPDDLLPELYRSVDKFDKVGADGVRKELIERGLPDDVVNKMMELIDQHQPGLGNLDLLESEMGGFPSAENGIRELREMAAHLDAAGVPADNYEIDFTMVRGLGYYTGPIFEAVVTEPNIGSISGGGRYDDLVGLFRGESLPTTGVSLGIERIIELMNEFDLYPPNISGTVVQVLVTVFNDDTYAASTKLTADLRTAGLRTELFMQSSKNLGKQFGHADKKGIPIVAVMGPEEIEKGVVSLKRLSDGEEVTVAHADAPATIRDLLA